MNQLNRVGVRVLNKQYKLRDCVLLDFIVALFDLILTNRLERVVDADVVAASDRSSGFKVETR